METMAGLLCKEQSTTAACITLVLCSVLNPQLRIEIQIFLGNFCPVKVHTAAIMAMIAHYWPFIGPLAILDQLHINPLPIRN